MTQFLFLVSDQPLTNQQYNLPSAIQEHVSGGIQLISYEFAIKQQMTTDVSNSARTSGRPIITDITVEKEIDQSSPILADHCLRANPLGKSCRLLLFHFETDKLISKVEYELTNSMLASYQINSKESAIPHESIRINFTDLRQTYFDFGGAEPKQYSSGWSVGRNRPL